MKIKHLAECKTLDDLKQLFRKLTKKYHPDCGGTNDLMRELNTEFDYLKDQLKSTHKEDWKAQQEHANMDAFKEIINKIIHLPLKIEVCGDWVWIGGDTKEYKDYLKEAGCKWAPKKKKWYWAPYKLKFRPKGERSMEDIRNKYGSQKFQTNERAALA